MLFLLRYSLLNLCPAYRAKLVHLAQPGATWGTGQTDPGFQMLDGNRSLIEIDITHGDCQRLAYATAQPPEQPNQELIPQKLGGLF